MNNKTKKNIKLVFTFIFFILLIWFSRPLWHWFFMFIYKNPSFWEPLVLVAIFYVAHNIYNRKIKKEEKSEEKILSTRNSKMITISILILILGWPILGFFQAMYPQYYLSQHLDIEEITELPDMDPSVIRIMPLFVAERYAKDALQYPRFKLGAADISFVDETPHWVFPLVPDGLINFFILKDKGAAYVDMSTMKKNTYIIEEDMEIGPGMGITDWYKWKLYKEKYWVEYEDPYFIPINQELYIAVPIISYEYRWRFPTLYTVPGWAGIALISSDGEIEFLTPNNALKHPTLSNQKIYPERLSRYYINSFRYTHGIINKLFYHHEQLEIAEVPGQQNRQPFLVVTENGMKWFVGCEPFGEAHGIFRIYLIDARTGEIQFNERAKAEALIGPVKAGDYVRKANPIVDWNRMMPVEPIPLISQGKLYWEVRVIPKDGSGIAYTGFVDSETSDVTELHTDESIIRFVKGEPPKEEIEEKIAAEEIIKQIKELLDDLESRFS